MGRSPFIRFFSYLRPLFLPIFFTIIVLMIYRNRALISSRKRQFVNGETCGGNDIWHDDDVMHFHKYEVVCHPCIKAV